MQNVRLPCDSNSSRISRIQRLGILFESCCTVSDRVARPAQELCIGLLSNAATRTRLQCSDYTVGGQWQWQWGVDSMQIELMSTE